MANTHGVLHTTHCACENVGALNFVGICENDIDNGTFLKLGAIKNTDGQLDEYVFDVTADANGAATQKYVAVTPRPGSSANLEIQLYADPRYFYNEAGKPISMKRIINGDCIELTKEAFGEGKSPVEQATYTTASIGADGKLQMVAQDGDFTLLTGHTIAIGQAEVPSWILMYMGQ